MPCASLASSSFCPKNVSRLKRPSLAAKVCICPSTVLAKARANAPVTSRANRPSQSLPHTSLMTFQPAPVKSFSSSSMMRPLPRTGPSKRCRLQLTTQTRLSRPSRAASVKALMDSGSSISPSPNTPQTLRAEQSSRLRWLR